MQKGQASIEYILTIGTMLLILGGVLLYTIPDRETRSRGLQANEAVDAIRQTKYTP